VRLLFSLDFLLRKKKPKSDSWQKQLWRDSKSSDENSRVAF